MGIIPRTKTGDCDCGCGGKDIPVIKVGKQKFCLQSYRKAKAAQYTAKANQNSKVRLLGKKQVASGDYFQAERQALMNDLDYVFSRIVKLISADSETGLVTCYTCSNFGHWSMPSFQCGHFISRKETLLRWDFRNARVQCRTCNEVKSGNISVYKERLEEEHKGITEQLIEASSEPYKWSREELKQLLIDYRARLRILEEKIKAS